MIGLTAASLKALRAAAGWSQRDLAARAGVHLQTVKYQEGRTGLLVGASPAKFRAAFASAGVKSAPENTAGKQAAKASTGGASDRLGGVTCGARTRAGKPCGKEPRAGKTRCRFHGGESTGPRSAAGRERIAQAQRQRWALAKLGTGMQVASA